MNRASEATVRDKLAYCERYIPSCDQAMAYVSLPDFYLRFKFRIKS